MTAPMHRGSLPPTNAGTTMAIVRTTARADVIVNVAAEAAVGAIATTGRTAAGVSIETTAAIVRRSRRSLTF